MSVGGLCFAYVGMYKNQLQELAQRSCFNLPSYACIREGPDHAPRFKATVNFNGEAFESPTFCTTLRQAEHAAAEVALGTLSKRGPSRSLAAKVLDETGVYKNLLQETAHRAGMKLPVYTTVRSGPGHTPIFSCTVELAGMSFSGESAKTKKQAQKNAAMAAWSALKQLPNLDFSSSSSSSSSITSSSLSPSSSSSSTSSSSGIHESNRNDEQEQVVIARALTSLHQSSEGNKYTQNDRQHGRRRPNTTRRELGSSTNQSYYMPCQSWAHRSFSAEAAIYQMWHPFHNSMFHPAQSQLFPVLSQEPITTLPCFPEPTQVLPVYFLDYDYSLPVPPRTQSQVKIQEINDEKSQGEENQWLYNPIPDAVDHSSKALDQNGGEVEEEDVAVSIEQETDLQSERSHRKKPFDWVSRASMRPGNSSNTKSCKLMPRDHPLYRPRFDYIQPRPGRPSAGYSSRSRVKPNQVLSMAAPVTIRTAVPVFSARPLAESSSPLVLSDGIRALDSEFDKFQI
ncbi:hypothetical protein IEQ34_004785 [Dendrobium chrysotoxum]|uniref:DRBM domain-containing protein n=1 Tax=Dendrobium chrysotoxum TaxID=161865 RepID=A0AAV7H6T0_DENCH|nr:hypothetical protein IEQ34_004785 [Dendrobium chrysotoxum]